MTIYVLNILNDSIRLQSKITNFMNNAKCTIFDAQYISSFSYVNKNATVAQLNRSLINIFEIIKKYKVSSIEALEIFEIIFGNDYNDWIINKIHKNECNSLEEKLILPHIVNDILENDTNDILLNLSSMSDNIKKIVLKTMFIPLDESKSEIEKYKTSHAC